MTYPNLFLSRYTLKGSDWICYLPEEDRRVFHSIGFQASDYGRKGGRAIVEQRGVEYMREIGRRGAVMTNIKKQWDKVVAEETEKEFGYA